jgi:ketosteroid isomerase-like protein
MRGGNVADKVSIARSSYDAWNERDFDTLAGVMAKGEIVIAGTGERLPGAEGARQFAERWTTGFPDGRIEVDTVCESEDMVCIEYTGRGTHTGPLNTPMGSFEATGRPVELKLCDCWTFASDGAAKEIRTYFDSGSLMAQLGLMPQMAGAV